MTRKFQFVAVMLALLIAFGSVPVSARCIRTQPSNGKAEHCPPDCPMMVHAQGATQQEQAISKAPTVANCCNVSTSRPETAAQVQPPTNASVLLVPEVGQLVDFEFETSPESASTCSFFGLGQSSTQVLRI
jgi:hypothetical protein